MPSSDVKDLDVEHERGKDSAHKMITDVEGSAAESEGEVLRFRFVRKSARAAGSYNVVVVEPGYGNSKVGS